MSSTFPIRLIHGSEEGEVKVKNRKIDGWFVITVIFLLLFLTYLYPFAYMISTSLKLRTEYYKFPASLLVREVTTSNYQSAFSAMDVPRGLMNSLEIGRAHV